MKQTFKQEYRIKGNGYPLDLPELDDFICPPYNMSYLEQEGVAVQYQQDDNLDPAYRWAIQYWLLLNSHFSSFHNSPFGNEEAIITMAEDECELLFGGFIEMIRAKKDIPFTIANYQAKLWISSTEGIVFSSFRNNRLSSDRMNSRRSTVRLLKHLLFKLDELYDSFLKSAPDSSYAAVDACIMYNLWGDEYRQMYEAIMEKDILTSSDKAKVNVMENKRVFYEYIEERVRVAVEESSEQTFYEKARLLCSELERMFVDYTRQLRKTKIIDVTTTNHICEYWRYVTVEILYRAYAILSGEFAVEFTKRRFSCLTPCKDGEEMPAYNKRSLIVEMAVKTVNSICEEYVKKGQTNPWDSKLRALDIHYEDLYSAMKDVYFTGVTLNDFECAIRDADFYEILVCAERKGIRSGMIGAIYYFISELGDNLGKDWLDKAAKSVTKQKDTVDAVKQIRSHSRTNSQKALGELLKRHITYYEPRTRKLRETQ